MKRKAKGRTKTGARTKSDKPPATSPIVLRRLADLERRMQRMEDGHSGDREAHAALAPGYVRQEQREETNTEQPASDAAQPADEPAEQTS